MSLAAAAQLSTNADPCWCLQPFDIESEENPRYKPVLVSVQPLVEWRLVPVLLLVQMLFRGSCAAEQTWLDLAWLVCFP